MIALVDCNNFFVSCERVFRPDLDGKPVVVLSNNDGCIVSRSNESKAMGIAMGTPFFKVRHLVECGALTAFSSNYALYGDMSARVMSILADAVPKIEIYSIDEAYLHIEGISQSEVPTLCKRLREKVLQWVGIPVSIGVAPTKTLAKVASRFAKKYTGYNGVCMMDTDSKRIKALQMTPIADVWGVGRKLAPKMNEWGIGTAYEFTQRPENWVGSRLGVNGLRTWKELGGIACLDEERDDRRKSICTSRSFACMISGLDELEQRVSDFAAMCAKKLREEGSAAYDVTAFLYTNRFRDDMSQYFPSVTIRLEVAANSTQEIVCTALRALRLIYKPEYQYKKAGVTVSAIVPADAVQGVLFDHDEQRWKNDRISAVMDRLGGGPQLLRLASQHPGHYADCIRSEHRSALYTTSLQDIIKVR